MNSKNNNFTLYVSSVNKRYFGSNFIINNINHRVFVFFDERFKKKEKLAACIMKNLFINTFLLKEYAVFFIFIVVCFMLSFLLFLVAKKVNKEFFYNEKAAPYECGFEAFSDARGRINIHFYVIALLFVIFDVEVIYFLPGAVNFYSLGFIGYFAMVLFNVFLVAGFIYEGIRGTFDWAKPAVSNTKTSVSNVSAPEKNV